eukprot:jgi/Mesen1/10362/ME000080S09744
MVADKKDFQSTGFNMMKVTPTRVALMVVAGLACVLVAEQAGWLPFGSNDTLSNINVELSETRRAMEAMKAMALQKPWQEFGQCSGQLEQMKKDLELARREARSGDAGGVGASGDCSRQVEDAKQSALASCPPQKREEVSCTAEQLKEIDVTGELGRLRRELQELQDKYVELHKMYDKITNEKSKLDAMEQLQGSMSTSQVSDDAIKAAQAAIAKCSQGPLATLAPGGAGGGGNGTNTGYACAATAEEIAQYLDYTPRAPCPDDWYFVQQLIFVKNCYCLPKRRCLARTPRTFSEPLPFPQSLFDQRSLADENVRWDLHECKNFECLNTRVEGDCRNCFNLSLEAHRWKSYYRGAIKMADVIDMKKGSLRIGLDAGGGSGSFAAHMARFNVTILTTAMNIETVYGRDKGLPYMETIALRGLVPLHWPHKARLPFFDNTLDVIHSVNSIKYLELIEYEELVMEWDRVLRPGGIMWFEMFYTPVEEMPLYTSILDLLGYNRLYWNLTPKPDDGEREGAHVYLNCVIEKPARNN